MEEGLKQRVVGAVVLVTLAVIFIPMLLDFSHEAEVAKTALPDPPEEDAGFSSRIVPLEETQDLPSPAAPEGSGEPVLERAAGDALESQSVDESSDSPPGADSVADLPEGGDGAEPRDEEVTLAPREEEERSVAPSWAAQLGSFADRRNALVLRNRLRAEGYAAFTESATSDEGEVTRVLVGPEPTRDRTVSTIEALRRDTGMDAFVVRYPRG